MVIIVKLLNLSIALALLSTIAFAPPLAANTAGTITLSWNANTESDIAGYHLHYGTASAPYKQELTVATTSAVVSNLTDGATYTFAVTAYNTAGEESAYSQPVSYTVGSDRVVPPAILANLSTRAVVEAGQDVMIGGFIVEGVVPKKVALRALGPSLAAAGVAGAISDPSLQLVDAAGTVVASNDDWNVAGEQIQSYGLAPGDARESALVATLSPGAYSAIVTGKGGASGVGLFEVYDLDVDFGRVANISTRSRVESGDDVMIGGFIMTGIAGNEVIVRAIGPSLAALGVTDVLADPSLELYDSNGTLIESNDNWRSTQESQIIDTNLAPSDNREAAIVTTLVPGAYSTIVRSANGVSGIALVEVYALN